MRKVLSLVSVLIAITASVSFASGSETVGATVHNEIVAIENKVHAIEEEVHHDVKEFNATEMIKHHVVDAHDWHIADYGHTSIVIPLPIILKTDKGFEVFCSSDFKSAGDAHHGPREFGNYVLDHEHITAKDGSKVLDLSITKNVASMFLASILLILVAFAVKAGYSRNRGKAPKGIQSFIEPVILYIRDIVAIPNLGDKYKKYFPFLLTLFFFILFNNLLGLLPGGANASGNISFTVVLAVIVLIITTFSGNKSYWGHIFAPPGVPVALYPIMVPVEIIGMFTKPFALTIRLFANITAGHIIILSLFSFIFIFKSFAIGIGSSLFVIFMTFLELLVAFLQPFIFTMLASLYIGAAVEDHGHAHDEHH